MHVALCERHMRFEMSQLFSNRPSCPHVPQTEVRLEVCPAFLQHPAGPVPDMEQPECPDVWDAAVCHTDR